MQISGGKVALYFGLIFAGGLASGFLGHELYSSDTASEVQQLIIGRELLKGLAP